jgi:hypothetical protein
LLGVGDHAGGRKLSHDGAMLKHETAWNEIFSVTDIFNRKHHILGHANSKPLPHPPQQKSLNPLKIKALKMAPAVGSPE